MLIKYVKEKIISLRIDQNGGVTCTYCKDITSCCEDINPSDQIIRVQICAVQFKKK